MGGDDWNNSLFGCLGSPGNCLCNLCCHCCQAGESASRLNESYFLYCIMAAFIPCVPWFLLRSKVRDRYNIDGGTGADALATFCCEPCVGCQIANELDDRSA